MVLTNICLESAKFPDGQVKLPGQVILDTVAPGSNITDTIWATTWTPAVSGTYTISATLTDQLNNQLIDTVQVTVGDGAPTAVTMRIMAAGTADNPYFI
jgi:hypothetical protein